MKAATFHSTTSTDVMDGLEDRILMRLVLVTREKCFCVQLRCGDCPPKGRVGSLTRSRRLFSRVTKWKPLVFPRHDANANASAVGVYGEKSRTDESSVNASFSSSPNERSVGRARQSCLGDCEILWRRLWNGNVRPRVGTRARLWAPNAGVSVLWNPHGDASDTFFNGHDT